MADILTTADASTVVFEGETEKGIRWLESQRITVPASEAAALKRSAEADGLIVAPSGL
jgi:hypothetical protein